MNSPDRTKFYLNGLEGHCAKLRLLAIHLPGEVHHLAQTLHKVYQLHGEVFDLIGPEGHKIQFFGEKR